MDIRKFEEYDLIKLKKAKQLLTEVLNYYYGYPPMQRKAKRLETIVLKLETLLNLD